MSYRSDPQVQVSTRERNGRRRSVFQDGTDNFTREAPLRHRRLGQALSEEVVSAHPAILQTKLQLPAAPSLPKPGGIARALYAPTARDSGQDGRMSFEEGSSKLCANAPFQPASAM